ncbi:MAG: glycoside hydrolase family 26 protein [Marinilabiliaceae bacterium]
MGIPSLTQATHNGITVKTNADASFAFDISRADADTITIDFDKPVFFTDLDLDKVTTTNGATVTSINAGGAGSKTLTMLINIPDLGKEYEFGIPAAVITNGQLKGIEKDIKVSLRPATTPAIADKPVIATQAEAINLYNFLRENYGKKTISGMMAKVAWNTDYADSVGDRFGKTPLINGFDYIHLYAEKDKWIDYTDITPVKNWAAKGGIAAMTWHWMVPQSPYYTDKDLTITTEQIDLSKVKSGDYLSFDVVIADKKDEGKYSIKYADGTEIKWLKDIKFTENKLNLEIADSTLTEAKSRGGLTISGSDFRITNVTATGNNLRMTQEQLKEAYDNIPTSGQNCSMTYQPSSSFKASRIFDATGAVCDSTWEGYVYKRGIETVIERLTLLKDAGIPVLWRPFHEAAGQWFWWGEDATTFKRLWVDMFNRFKDAGLDNLIWVWTSQVSDISQWYPGDEYVDIIGVDIYGGTAKDAQSENLSEPSYDYIKLSQTGKMLTLSEGGYNSSNMSRVAKISAQMNASINWSWFMPWYDDSKSKKEEHHADDAWWTDAINSGNVLWLGDYTK